MLNSESKPVKNSRVLLLGVTYKANISDIRESPAVDVAKILDGLGAKVFFSDPYVDLWDVHGVQVTKFEDWQDGLQDFDVAVLLQAHDAFDFAEV